MHFAIHFSFLLCFLLNLLNSRYSTFIKHYPYIPDLHTLTLIHIHYKKYIHIQTTHLNNTNSFYTHYYHNSYLHTLFLAITLKTVLTLQLPFYLILPKRSLQHYYYYFHTYHCFVQRNASLDFFTSFLAY